MASKRVINERTALATNVDPNWSRWLRMVRELPEIRSDKVRATREAIANNKLEDEEVWDAAIERLSRDLGEWPPIDQDPGGDATPEAV